LGKCHRCEHRKRYRKGNFVVADDREDLGNIIALKSVKQELSDAVRIAEKSAAGRALAGGLTKQDGKLNFVVVISSDGRLKEVMLEPPRVGKQGATLH
jgi:uncharacterized membrane protein YkoI